MRSLLVVLALAVAAYAIAIPQKTAKVSAVADPFGQKLAALDGMLCSVCKDLINDAENAGEGDIKTWLETHIDQLCSHLGFLAKECSKILDDLVDQIIDLINQHIGADEICQKIDLC